MRHEIKLGKRSLGHIIDGMKKFEVRYNDRDYQVGDLIRFNVEELPSMNKILTDFRITYLHYGYGMEDGYVVLGIEPVKRK